MVLNIEIPVHSQGFKKTYGHANIEQTKGYALAEKTRLARVIEMQSRKAKKSTYYVNLGRFKSL